MPILNEILNGRKLISMQPAYPVDPKALLGGAPSLALTAEAKSSIVYKWRVGRCPIRDIARQEGLTVRQIEDLIWRHLNAKPGPTDPVTVRASRGLHLVTSRRESRKERQTAA